MDLREKAKALACLAQMYPFDAPQVPRPACEANMREAMAQALEWAASYCLAHANGIGGPGVLRSLSEAYADAFRVEAARLREAK